MRHPVQRHVAGELKFPNQQSVGAIVDADERRLAGRQQEFPVGRVANGFEGFRLADFLAGNLVSLPTPVAQIVATFDGSALSAFLNIPEENLS